MDRTPTDKLTDPALIEKFDLVGVGPSEVKVRCNIADMYQDGEDIPFRIITYEKTLYGWTPAIEIEIDGISCATIHDPEEDARTFWEKLRKWAGEEKTARRQQRVERVGQYVERISVPSDDEMPF